MNLNQLNPISIISEYKKYLNIAKIDPMGLVSILEIGVGATNSTGYEMAHQGFAQGGKIFMLEPYTVFDPLLDNKLFTTIGYDEAIRNKVNRLTNISGIKTNSVDLILSNSVLEHVEDFLDLMGQLRRVLKPKEYMLHIVDYRDHFLNIPIISCSFQRIFGISF